MQSTNFRKLEFCLFESQINERRFHNHRSKVYLQKHRLGRDKISNQTTYLVKNTLKEKQTVLLF